DGEVVGGGRADAHGAARAGDGAGSRVGGRDRPAAHRSEDGGERTDARGQGRVGRQSGLRVGAREMHRAGVAGGHVVERVEGGDRDVVRAACGGRGRDVDGQVVGGGRVDGDGAARAGDRAGRRVGGRDRPAARGHQGDTARERVDARVAGNEGVVRR